MRSLVRPLALAAAVATLAFLAGIRPGMAQGDDRPSSPGSKPGALDVAAVEQAVNRAVKAAVDQAMVQATERLQKAPALADAAALRQRLADLDKLRDDIRTEISRARATMLQYALLGAAGIFAVMVLASVLGGAIVAALFASRRRARN